MKVKSESEVAQSCLTLSDPMDCSLPGSSVHGICQARVLEWGAIAFSNNWISGSNTLLLTLICFLCCLTLLSFFFFFNLSFPLAFWVELRFLLLGFLHWPLVLYLMFVWPLSRLLGLDTFYFLISFFLLKMPSHAYGVPPHPSTDAS